ncbi:putative membrane protein [Balneicella halophila]|uniref:Putative membrane protein n=1 Tax=Balneicella halophila TaxID=1537566 RepID=A0A7L4UPU6_BALHA|nr:DUF819 family protein [Balneicella halophila]PVX51798.1 putative membrane protein [Balneicella halophila]
MDTIPFITNDAVVLGILMILLGGIFYTSAKATGFWAKFYKIIPSLLVAYMLPAVLTSMGLIAPEWKEVTADGEIIERSSQLYFVASRYLLPASLVLMTLSVDLKAVFKLGYKALVMFFAGTIGIVAGGPLAVLLVSLVSPETVGGAGFDAVWRGLATIAGSWIGGGANQIAMLEIYEFNPQRYGGFVLVDIIVANILLAVLLFGIGRKDKIDRWLKADTSAIENLRKKVSDYAESLKRIPSLTDYMVILAIAFGSVGFAHFAGGHITDFLVSNYEIVSNKTSAFSSFGSEFFWLISLSVILGVALSFTKFREYEGAGASKIGSLFIYILVVTIGMKMDLRTIFENPGLFIVGLIWISIHFIILLVVAKLIKAPFFFMAVGSTANVGGAASAPIVATAFHPALATVGVLLAVLGYVVGTYGALLTAELMRIVAP